VVAVRSEPSARARLRASIALGVALAPRGAMVKLAFGVGGIAALVAVIVAFALARGPDPSPPLAQLASATSSAMAWSAGILVAFASAAQGLRRDRLEGVRALVRARGGSVATYARGRVLGLAVVLALVVGGGTLVSGVVGVLVAARLGAAGAAAQGLVAALAYGVAFAFVIAPLSFAALGARTRAQGYLGLLLLLAVPEVLEPWSSGLVPHGWGDLLSVPSALAALRAALMPPGIDVARFARAACVLAAFAAVCFVLVRAEIARVDHEEAGAP
jgi:hypothetical protein